MFIFPSALMEPSFGTTAGEWTVFGLARGGYFPKDNAYFTDYVSGLPMDLIHAAATVIFILIAAEPMLEKLDRIKVKYGLVE